MSAGGSACQRTRERYSTASSVCSSILVLGKRSVRNSVDVPKTPNSPQVGTIAEVVTTKVTTTTSDVTGEVVSRFIRLRGVLKTVVFKQISERPISVNSTHDEIHILGKWVKVLCGTHGIPNSVDSRVAPDRAIIGMDSDNSYLNLNFLLIQVRYSGVLRDCYLSLLVKARASFKDLGYCTSGRLKTGGRHSR
jgi:hypothetical protein